MLSALIVKIKDSLRVLLSFESQNILLLLNSHKVQVLKVEN